MTTSMQTAAAGGSGSRAVVAKAYSMLLIATVCGILGRAGAAASNFKLISLLIASRSEIYHAELRLFKLQKSRSLLLIAAVCSDWMIYARFQAVLESLKIRKYPLIA